MSKIHKTNQLNLSFNIVNRFDGKLIFNYDNRKMDFNDLVVYVETFAKLKRMSNKGDRWHAFMRGDIFTMCESKFAMNLILDDWKEIGNIEL